MRWIETVGMSRLELDAALRRPPLEEVAAAPEVLERTASLFGHPVSPLEAVRRIVEDVATRGDEAVIEWVQRLDGARLTPGRLFVAPAEIERARQEVEATALEAIRRAAANIRAFHERERRNSWFLAGPGGSLVGQRIIPLQRAAVYVPGGRAPLASTALMATIPARVAGVGELIVATPCDPAGRVDPYLLVAASEGGADRILRVGGPVAIAALAYGTGTVPRVDKICGPGNLFVQLAKKLVFGRVGIDALNGPSEILVIADGSARPDWVAADLLSQAEHDPEAAAILVTPDAQLARAVVAEVERQLAALPRRETAAASWRRWGAVVVCRDLDEAVAIANRVAPEHVELLVADPWPLLDRIRHAGAVFLGPASTEPIGDYVAGPNHILPTNGAARFWSPLGVDDFVRRSSVIAYTRAGVLSEGPAAIRLAELEGLEGHARAVRARLEAAPPTAGPAAGSGQAGGPTKEEAHG